jgi:hypothetical protein
MRGIDLGSTTIDALSELVRKKEISPVEIIKAGEGTLDPFTEFPWGSKTLFLPREFALLVVQRSSPISFRAKMRLWWNG